MFIIFALATLLFGGFFAWTIASAFRTDKPVGWRDWLSCGLLAVGAFSTIVTALKVMFG